MNEAVAGPHSRQGRLLSFWLLVAVAAYAGLALVFGGGDTVTAARSIGLPWIAGGIVLTLISLAIRALRWHCLLRVAGSRVRFGVNAVIYLAGIGLSATPGKVGETVRSAFLVRHGVPVGTSLAAFVADRLSDLHAVLLIALLAAAFTSGWNAGAMRWTFVLACVAAAPLALAAAVRSPAWQHLIGRLEGLRALRRSAGWLHRGGRDFARLWQTEVATWSIAASLLAYGLQAAIFAGMTAQIAPHVHVLLSCGIFAAAALAGAASFLPGGVGAMELALVLLLEQQGVNGEGALAVALCLRAVTLWFALLLGAASLGAVARLGSCEPPLPPPADCAQCDHQTEDSASG